MVPVFGHAFGAAGSRGGVVMAGLASAAVLACFVLAFGTGIVLGVAFGTFGQFVVLICVCPGAGCVHWGVFALLFGLAVTGDSGLVAARVV
jgi:hypothetical protein